LLITVNGEPPGHLLLEQFQEGLARKLLCPGMQTLVDMTRFIGVVDWQAVAKLRTLAPWGECRPSAANRLPAAGKRGCHPGQGGRRTLSRQRASNLYERAAAIAWLES
jgi:hypothetical protein